MSESFTSMEINNSTDTREKITRPVNYIKQLYVRCGFHWSEHLIGNVVQVLDNLLSRPEILAKEIINVLVHPMSSCVLFEPTNTKKYYLLSSNCGWGYIVVDQSIAKIIVNDLLESKIIEPKLATSQDIRQLEVKTFDDVKDILIRINPWLLLEMYVTAIRMMNVPYYPNTDFNYQVNQEEYHKIKEEIIEHKKVLEKESKAKIAHH